MKTPEHLGRFLYWKEQRLRGRADIRSRLEWLMETQWLTPKEVKEVQLTKLRQVVEHAYKTVPYYKEVMEERGLKPQDINDSHDLRKLPLLTRNLLSVNKDRLLSSEADHETLQTNYSSGSTGVRAEFTQDLNFRMWMRAHQLRTYQWCGNWRLGEPFVLLWGSEIYWSYKQLVDRVENFLTNRREFNTFRLSNDLVSRFLTKLVRFKPALVSTYTNAMHLISREAEKQGVRIEGLRAIQTTSEPLPPAMRDRISSIFDCEVFDKYGSRESNIVSHESPSHEGMCIQAENVYIEFIGEDGQPTKGDEKGKIVLTTLNNMSMPLIRYETSDIASAMSGYCSSGIGLPRMSGVAGRLQDLIVSPNGDYIDAYFFSYLFMRFNEIHWFQIVQSESDRLLVRLFAPTGLSLTTRKELLDRIHHHTGYPYKVEWELLTAMPESSTGKYRLCVSELDDVKALLHQYRKFE